MTRELAPSRRGRLPADLTLPGAAWRRPASDSLVSTWRPSAGERNNVLGNSRLWYTVGLAQKSRAFFLFGFGVLAVSRQASEYDINSTVPINYSYFSERQASGVNV